MRHGILRGLALAGPLLLTQGCTGTEVLCAAPSIPSAVAVVVRDSVTGALLTDSAYGAVTGKGQTDSLYHGGPFSFGDSVLVGGTVVGTVTVEARGSGYQPSVDSTVKTRLSGGDCPDFVTKHLTARMQP